MLLAAKVLLAALATSVGLLMMAVAWGLVFGLPGSPPAPLGIQADGRLSPCPPRPNCVLSDGGRGHAAVEPLPLRGSGAESLARAEVAIQTLPRIQILTRKPGYLHATQTSRWLGFVDDLELRVDEDAGVLHLRSASRLGRNDFGVNRRRVEALRAAYLQQP